MKIIVGLGNPGSKYLFTRHNLGFMIIDALSESSAFQTKYKSQIQKIEIQNKPLLLVKPQTFMNLSGQAVREIISFYKIALEDLLVIHDDKDLAFGTMKFQKSRGHGGHNGIKNIHQELKSQDYIRLKMGVAGEKNFEQDTSDFVLSAFSEKERENLTDFLNKAVRAIECFVVEGFNQASSQFNSKELI
ncbi:MAG: aminoacyl-tRNA hydrolase [Bdellovibrionaceae bacterium]|nr:aminoacyl-tRNA hydrolase [Pseudobdellovibrionaceae bacterium]